MLGGTSSKTWLEVWRSLVVVDGQRQRAVPWDLGRECFIQVRQDIESYKSREESLLLGGSYALTGEK